MKQKAFTLPELFVVMAIIIVVIALSIPTVARVREAGRVTVCLSNLRQLGAALISYTMEDGNDGRVPHMDMWGVQSETAWVGKKGIKFTANDFSLLTVPKRPLNKYLGATDNNDEVPAAFCPSDHTFHPPLGFPAADLATGIKYTTYTAIGSSYIANITKGGGPTTMSQNGSKDVGVKLSAIKNPSRMVAIVEGMAKLDGYSDVRDPWVTDRFHPDGRWGLVFADGHSGRYLINKSDNGSTPDFTFWNDK